MKYMVIVGALVSFTMGLKYASKVIKGSVKPNKVTWLMWSIAPLIATMAAISDGVRLSVLPVFMSGFTPLLIFATAMFSKKAYWKLSKFDISCGILSLFALIIWYITKDPNLAIIFAITSDALAAIPTITKSWNFPETESGVVSMGGLFSVSTSFFAITSWNFSSLAFPIYLITLHITILFSIYHKRKNKRP